MIRSYRGIVPSIAPSAFIEASAQIIGDVAIGEHSSVWFNAVIRSDVFPIRCAKNYLEYKEIYLREAVSSGPRA